MHETTFSQYWNHINVDLSTIFIKMVKIHNSNIKATKNKE